MKKKFAALLMAGLMVANSTVPVFADELSVTDGSGQSSTTVTGSISAITTMDVTVPVGGINFAIDSDSQITAQGIVIESNTAVPLTVNIIGIEALDAGDTTNGLTATTMDAPGLVNADFHTEERWDNLSRNFTFANIALALKQVDVIDNGDGTYSASTEITNNTTDIMKRTRPVELADTRYTNEYRMVAHMKSGYTETTRIGINLETDTKYTNYGKAWVSDQDIVFRYNMTMEFAYDEYVNVTINIPDITVNGITYKSGSNVSTETKSLKGIHIDDSVYTTVRAEDFSYFGSEVPGYTLDGWYTDDTYTTKVTGIVTEDYTVYGRWVETQ